MTDLVKEHPVVVGVDDGPHSAAAFRRALRMFPRDATHYHIVNVRPSETEFQIDEMYAVGIQNYWEELEEQRQRRCQATLGGFRATAQQANVKFTAVELQGDAREELCSYCKNVNADVLVLGCRGAGFLERLLLGSVSTYCTQHAPCAVLVDRCPEAEASEEAAPSPAPGPVAAAGS